MSRFLFLTGGVVSSLGKGVTAASLGMLLTRRGVKVAMLKIDPYINVDPGNMNPYQQGEIFVTADGIETDLDLGHYERFLDTKMTKIANFTAGEVYSYVIKKERAGGYGGKTVQVVPHITDTIKKKIFALEKPEVDLVIVELGGTVGDIEGLPFLEAIRQITLERKKNEVLCMHMTLIPYLSTSKEIKTKPTQHSVQKLREIGIQPNMLICRTSTITMDTEAKTKLARFCHVRPECVFEERDIDTTIYELPRMLYDEGIDKAVSKYFNLNVNEPYLLDWDKAVNNARKFTDTIEIAFVGKYTTHTDAYQSLNEALIHAGSTLNAKVKIRSIEAEEVEKKDVQQLLGGVSGVLVPSGFGSRGADGKVKAISWARNNDIPFLGIGYGMQCAVVEYAKNVCGIQDAASAEWSKAGSKASLVVDCIACEDAKRKNNNTMRLGEYEARLKKDTLAYSIYKSDIIKERHRHRFDVNPQYLPVLEQHGLVVSGVNLNNNLPEIIEIPAAKWFLGIISHPEFNSRLIAPHPLFISFLNAAKNIKNE